MQTHILSRRTSERTSDTSRVSPTYSEAEIVQGIKAQSTSVLSWIYKRYFPVVKGLILQRGGSSAEAQDIFQEAITAVYINILKDKYTTQNKFGAYLRQVSMNMWNGHLRKRSKLPMKTFCDPQDDRLEQLFSFAEKEYLLTMETELRTAKLAEIACECLAKLRPDAQQLMRLYYFERRKLKDLADHFGWTEGYIKQKVRRCRQQLEKLICNHPAYKELFD